MKWKKIKQLFQPVNGFDWMVTHAANPFAVYRGNNIFRIYFTCRNAQNHSYIGFVDVDFADDFAVKQISDKPVLAPGEPGIFDDSGVAMGFYLEIDTVPHIYYLGWNLKVTVPWLNTIGLSKYNGASGTFEKTSRAPMMDRSDEDPFSISYPSVLFDSGLYKMWYGSNLKWGKTQDEMNHVIKYAESVDGKNWRRTNEIHINLQHPNEYALSKPFVLKDADGYHMWYSYRANGTIDSYRIGYAHSADSKNWVRKDNEAGIDVSQDGWDSEMICYPCVFDYAGERYMLYNGNGYGKTGFGLAVLEK